MSKRGEIRLTENSQRVWWILATSWNYCFEWSFCFHYQLHCV